MPATVRLNSGEAKETDGTGALVLPCVQPGAYSLLIKSAGRTAQAASNDVCRWSAGRRPRRRHSK